MRVVPILSVGLTILSVIVVKSSRIQYVKFGLISMKLHPLELLPSCVSFAYLPAEIAFSIIFHLLILSLESSCTKLEYVHQYFALQYTYLHVQWCEYCSWQDFESCNG